MSRSGATISAGLLRDLDRVTATRMSFLLGIPALAAAGGLEAFADRHDIADTVGWSPTLVALVVSFVVGYISIAWLLRFVAQHSIVWFVLVPRRARRRRSSSPLLATGCHHRRP